MSDWDRAVFHLGIEALPLEDQGDINKLRKAIHAGQRDSALICNALRTAAGNGLDGEDTYVLLAYHALVQLETIYQTNCILVSLNPMPPRVRP